MTARHDDLTQMTANTDAEAQASPSIARKREAMALKRSADIARLSDEEIEILWGSLDEGTRAAYLRG